MDNSTWYRYSIAWTKPGVLSCKMIFVCLCVFAGCGKVRSVELGTPGELRMSGQPLAEIELKFFPDSAASSECVAVGVSNIDGSFGLMQPNAAGPVWLLPGKYRIAIESVGNPIQLPEQYDDPRESPLTYECVDSKSKISLNLPAEL